MGKKVASTISCGNAGNASAASSSARSQAAGDSVLHKALPRIPGEAKHAGSALRKKLVEWSYFKVGREWARTRDQYLSSQLGETWGKFDDDGEDLVDD